MTTSLSRTAPPSMDQVRQGRWAVATMFFTNGMVTGAWAPQIPLLLPRHAITEGTLGLLILFLGIGAVGAMLTAGRLIARFGTTRILRSFAFVLIPTLPLVVLAPNLPLLALTMALLGAFLGCMDVSMNANAVEVEQRLGRAIMSSLHGFWSLGGFFGASVGGWVVAQYGAMTEALLTGALCLVLVLSAMPRILQATAHHTAPDTPHEALFPRDLSLWLLGVMALLSMVPEGSVMDWGAIYLQKELGSAQATSTLGFAAFMGTMAIMRFAGDNVRNRFGAVATLRASGLIGAVGLGAAALAPSPAFAFAGFALAGIGVANLIPIIFSAAGNHPGLSAGTAIASVTMLGYSGILIAPASIGFVAEHLGFRITYGALAILLGVVAWQATRARAAER
jgi:MFS family permease